MNKVMGGYFDDSHRGLQRMQTDQRGAPSSQSHVQLPPLRSDSVSPGVSGDNFRPGGGDDGGAGGGGPPGVLRKSASFAGQEFSREQADFGVQGERYHQALQDNAKLSRKLRQMQEQLAITTAKKEAFRAQSQRLEKEFRKGREQSDTLQRDLLEAKRESAQCTKESQEAVNMMSEMRKAHIHEVRLLQRGLQQRGGSEGSRNRVNEVADLVDKVGRAVVQRDEAIRDKTKMQVTLSKAVTDLRAVSDEAQRMKKQNSTLSAQLKEARRKAQYTVPRPDADHPPDDSDEEFMKELTVFERRFEILEEGPAGLDILASNLSRDKANLEKRLKEEQENVRKCNQKIEDWIAIAGEKDCQIQELREEVEKMHRDQAILQESIEEKRREIEMQVAVEKAALEKRIEELQDECDTAYAQADGMEKVSNKLTRELVKVHENYAPSGGNLPALPEAAELLAKQEHTVKTGETLTLAVYKAADGAMQVRAHDVPSGQECGMLPLGSDDLVDFDKQNPWPDLFNALGVVVGPPRGIVIPSAIGHETVQLPPSGRSVQLTVQRFDRFRYRCVAVDNQGDNAEVTITEASLVEGAQSRLEEIENGGDSGELFRFMASGLSFQVETAGSPTLTFSAPAP